MTGLLKQTPTFLVMQSVLTLVAALVIATLVASVVSTLSVSITHYVSTGLEVFPSIMSLKRAFGAYVFLWSIGITIFGIPALTFLNLSGWNSNVAHALTGFILPLVIHDVVFHQSAENDHLPTSFAIGFSGAIAAVVFRWIIYRRNQQGPNVRSSDN